MRTELFDYQLPEELIAQRPAEKRDRSRMLVLNRTTGECVIREFADIVEYLSPGDLMVSNNTKVMRARLYGRKNGLAEGAHFEALLLNPHPAGEKVAGTRYQAMLKPGKRALPGTWVKLLDHAGNLLELSGSGVDGVAVVSAIFAAADPGKATARLLELAKEMVANG